MQAEALDNKSNFLTWRNITFRYSKEFDWSCSVDFLSVKKGEIVAIIGSNGSGKSTLLKLGAGILTPEEGRVEVGDQSLASLERSRVAKAVGYLPQSIFPYFNYTVREVVRLGRFPYLSGFGSLSEADNAAIEKAMHSTEVIGLKERRLNSLSGGEMQRALLASILAQNPEMLLLDEPTSSLDVHHQVSFFKLIGQLKDSGAGFAVVTHDLNLASIFADRLVLMNDGRILADGSPSEVITEDHLSQAYGGELIIENHPQNGRPVVLPATRT